MIREDIAAALFAKLQTAAGFKTASRRLRHWDDVPPAQQPALFLSLKTEDIATVPGLNPVSKITYDAVIYAHTAGNEKVTPSSLLNPLVDAVQATLKPDAAYNKQTLGGLVQHVWIEGRIVTDEGVLGDQGVVIIPIVMKVA